MKVQSLLLTLLTALWICAVPGTAGAQVLYGSLTGNVTDQAGAAVPGAKVEAVNVATGVAKITTTDLKGGYLFNDLQSGIYRVTLEAGSFRTLTQENVRIETNTVRRLDAQLQVSSVKDVVTVTATEEALQTDRADVNTVQTTRQINDLPLTGSLGRNYQSMMSLIPGAISAGEQNSAAGSPQRSISFNVNGVSRLQNNTRIDGAGIVYPWLPTNTAYVPPAEAIQEVSIVTNSFDAEQGLAGGAAVNVIIKSGTNDFHGAGWVYHTNSATQARNYFQTTPQVPKNLLTQFGYAVGGPIIKNKLFFFTDLERTTQRNFARVQTYSLAPASLRPDANGNVIFPTGTTLYDPTSNPNPKLRTPFANNTIPANRIDPAALELIKRLPLPTGAGLQNNFTPTGVAEFNRNNIDNKINYNYSERFSIFGRYSISPTRIVDPPVLGEAVGDALNAGQLGDATGRVQVGGGGVTYTLSPTVAMDANFGYTRQRLGAIGPDIGTNFGLDVLKIPGTNGLDRLQSGVPFFNVNNWANMGNSNTGNPFIFRDNQYVAAINLSWQKRAHSLRFGLDYQNQQLNHFQPQGGTFQTARGTFQFSGSATALEPIRNERNEIINGAVNPNFLNSWADFLLGLPSGAGKVEQLRNPNALRLQSYALYARDRWQITNRLTFSYGLRWERYPFPGRDNTGVDRFDPTDGNVYTGGLTGVPENTGASSGPGQFLPRLGLAYRFGDKMVIRAGYGQSADPRSFIDFRNSYPAVIIWAMRRGQFNGVNNDFIPVTTLRQGLINPNALPDLSSGVNKLGPSISTSTYPKEWERKYIQSWNLTIERELPMRFTGQVGYIGTRATGQMGFLNINAGAPGTGDQGRPLASLGLTGDINMTAPYQTSTYDSLQATLTRRWSGSLFGVAYTLSKAINYADNDGGPRIQYFPEAQRNRGLAGYDRTHNLQTYWVWDLPLGKGQRWMANGLTGKLLSGFQFNGLLSASTGGPFSIIQGTAPGLLAGGSGQVPDQIKSEVATLSRIGSGNPYFDTSAFRTVSNARFGNVGRNTLRGPGYFNIDMGLFRTVSVKEHFQVQFRAEALNAFNHPNFGNPNGDTTNPNFGYILGTIGQGSRIWRFASRLSF